MAAPQTGTTIAACTYPGGVILGTDGRVSTGKYVSNRASNKLAKLSDNTYLLRSGSAADTQIVADYGASSTSLVITCKPFMARDSAQVQAT